MLPQKNASPMQLISFLPITKQDENFAEMIRLMQTSFPSTEHSSFKNSAASLQEEAFHPTLILRNQQIIGFLNAWYFDSFIYIEHYAIKPALQGQQIGTKALATFMKKHTLPIVLEVERPTCTEPNNEIRIRRIRFYERLHFKLHDEINYIQPPYQTGYPEIPLYLMVYAPDQKELPFETYIQTLRKRVYHTI